MEIEETSNKILLQPAPASIEQPSLGHLGSRADVCRLGNIKRLLSLRKLRLPMQACVGCTPDEFDDDGERNGEPRGVYHNFAEFLMKSLPDDTSQLGLEICMSLHVSLSFS